MHVRGNHRIPEVVRVFVALAAEIKPGLGILVHEQWSETSRYSGCRRIQTSCASRRSSSRRAAGGMSNRVPADTSSSFRCNCPNDIAGSRFPVSSHAARIEVSSESQFQSTRLKISYASMLISECSKCCRQVRIPHSRMAVSIGRDFRIPQSFARIDIGPVVEEAPVIREVFSNGNAAYSARALWPRHAGNKPAFFADAEAVSPKPVAAMLPRSLRVETFARCSDP